MRCAWTRPKLLVVFTDFLCPGEQEQASKRKAATNVCNHFRNRHFWWARIVSSLQGHVSRCFTFLLLLVPDNETLPF